MSVTLINVGTTNSSMNGKSWFCVSADKTGQYLVAGHIVGDIWRSTNYGSTWTNITTGTAMSGQYWRHIASDASGINLVVTNADTLNNGNIWTSSNSGATWTNRTTGTSAANKPYSNIVCDATGQYVYASCYVGDVWASSDYGVTWRDVSNPSMLNKGMQWITCSGNGQYVAICDNYTDANVWISSDYGSTWSAKSISGAGNMSSICMSYWGDQILVTDQSGKLFISKNLGKTWTNVTPSISGSEWIRCASDFTGQYLAASEHNTGLWLSSDNGSTWTLAQNFSNVIIENIKISHDARYIALTVRSQSLYVGTITNYNTTFNYSNPPSSNICFPAGTPILTDQGYFPIEQINRKVHTIRNEKIVAITKSVTPDKYLVCIEKDALGFNIPSQRTVISKNHCLLFQGSMIKAKELLGKNEDVKKVAYNGEVLYNVLLEKHSKIVVNNLICETLHPEHGMAILYRHLNNLDAKGQQELLQMVNNYAQQTKKLVSKRLK